MSRMAGKIKEKTISSLLFIKSIINSFGQHHCPIWAASLAYFAFFSIFPTLLFLVYIGTEILETGTTRADLRLLLDQVIPVYANQLNQIVDRTVDVRGPVGIAGAIGLLWSGSSIFNVLERALCEIWEVDPRTFWMRRILAIITLLSLGIVFTLSFFAGPMVRWVALGLGFVNSQFLSFAIAIVLGIITCYSFFRIFPNQQVHWKSALTGAVFCTTAMEGAKILFTRYLDSAFVDYGAVYGSLTWMVALALWVYLVGLLFFLGAEIAAAVEKRRNASAQS
jgi:membrane protein